jgi:hypothetical protein
MLRSHHHSREALIGAKSISSYQGVCWLELHEQVGRVLGRFVVSLVWVIAFRVQTACCRWHGFFGRCEWPVCLAGLVMSPVPAVQSVCSDVPRLCLAFRVGQVSMIRLVNLLCLHSHVGNDLHRIWRIGGNNYKLLCLWPFTSCTIKMSWSLKTLSPTIVTNLITVITYLTNQRWLIIDVDLDMRSEVFL